MKCNRCAWKEKAERLLWCSKHEEHLKELTDECKEACKCFVAIKELEEQSK